MAVCILFPATVHNWNMIFSALDFTCDPKLPQSLIRLLCSTGPSRCFPFWQEVLACYVVNTNSEDDSGKKKCAPVLDDYYECLHHKKEVSSSNLSSMLSTHIQHILQPAHQNPCSLIFQPAGCTRASSSGRIPESRSKGRTR